jgi:gamma-tubulin complex component 3
MGHCNSIRKYLLMGQGDFMQYLMDLLANELGEPASKIYRHSLMSSLETAVRSSNA